MEQGRWEHLEHDADIGLSAEAASRDALFATMAEALTAIVTDPAGVQATESLSVHCEAPDNALLLADWLNALIREMSARGMIFGSFDVAIDGQRLQARVAGEPVDRERHRPAVEVKGATYTELAVTEDANGRWHGRCVVDV